jgi:hypothetical protein
MRNYIDAQFDRLGEDKENKQYALAVKSYEWEDTGETGQTNNLALNAEEVKFIRDYLSKREDQGIRGI